MSMNHQIRLRSRPTGAPSPENFELAEAPMPAAGDGEVVRRTIYLSLDPYMRGRMSEAPSYAACVGLGEVMCGHTVSEVVESRDPNFRAGNLSKPDRAVAVRDLTNFYKSPLEFPVLVG